VLAELGRIPLDQPLGQVLQQVSDLATQLLPDVDALSVTLVDPDGSAHSAASTDRVSALLDERQYEDGFGPCTDAARSGGVVRIRDRGADPTYPGFSALARRHGVGSVVSVGVPGADRVVGALNIFTRAGDPLREDVVDLARVFAGYAGAALANAALYTSTVEPAEQMQQAMSSRAVIEQARGGARGRPRARPGGGLRRAVAPEPAHEHQAARPRGAGRRPGAGGARRGRRRAHPLTGGPGSGAARGRRDAAASPERVVGGRPLDRCGMLAA